MEDLGQAVNLILAAFLIMSGAHGIYTKSSVIEFFWDFVEFKIKGTKAIIFGAIQLGVGMVLLYSALYLDAQTQDMVADFIP